MSDPVEPAPVPAEPSQTPAPDTTLPPDPAFVGEQGPELLDLPPTGRTRINLMRQSRRIE